jgi:hypothetical protein
MVGAVTGQPGEGVRDLFRPTRLLMAIRIRRKRFLTPAEKGSWHPRYTNCTSWFIGGDALCTRKEGLTMAMRHILVGLGLGAGAMYFFDPVVGRRRRSIARDKLLSLARESSSSGLSS